MKPDFLKECLSSVEPVPIDHFQAAWCRICGNRECSRSPMNNSLFDLRARDWKKTLFEEPRIVDPSDTRYDNVRSKAFTPGGLSVSSVGIPVIDPSIGAPNRGFVPMSFIPKNDKPEEGTPQEPIEAAQDETASQEALAPQPAPSPPPQPQIQPQPPIGVPGNTRFQQGMVLGGGEEGTKLGSDQTYVIEDD